MNVRIRKDWTQDEIAYLIENYLIKIDDEIAIVLNRTERSIHNKRRRLRLLRPCTRKSNFHPRHGQSKHWLYTTWCAMKDRCNNPKCTSYKHYGGRGIHVYEEWSNSFARFAKYIEEEVGIKEPGQHLDRIDNDRGYEPGNLRWVSPKENMNNRRPYRNARGRMWYI